MTPAKTLEQMFLAREIGRRILASLKDVDDVGAGILVDALMSVAVAFVTAADLDEEALAEEWVDNVKTSKQKHREREE
jgi:hypothetical protein